MRICEVRDMDEIAYTGAVVRLIIGTKDCYRWSTSRDRVKDQRYQMRLGIVILPDLIIGISSCGIEIPKRNPGQPMSTSEVGEHSFHHKLGSTVRIDRALWYILGDGELVGYAVSGARA